MNQFSDEIMQPNVGMYFVILLLNMELIMFLDLKVISFLWEKLR